MFQFFTVNSAKENGCHGHRHQFGDREGPPYCMKTKNSGENIGRRQNCKNLSCQRHDQTVNTIAKGLEYGTDDDAVAGKQEAQADDAQCRNADGEHFRGSVEQSKKFIRNQDKQCKSNQHQADCGDYAQLNRLNDTFFVACPVVVSDDWNHSVVQTEDRHENKTVQFEVNTEYGSGGRREHEQDFVKAKGHDRADGLHNDTWYTHLINTSDG